MMTLPALQEQRFDVEGEEPLAAAEVQNTRCVQLGWLLDLDGGDIQG